MRKIIWVMAFAAACDAYDRDLGPAPFLCGPDEPRCPMGYECMTDGISGDEICVGKGGSVNDDFDCADDSAYEPNDSLMTATPAIGSSNTFMLDNLAVCPAPDKDAFSIMITANGSTVEIVVTFDPANVPLHADFVNEGGVPIATTSSDGTGTARVTRQNIPIGQYYAVVAGPNTGTPAVNNYKITITVN